MQVDQVRELLTKSFTDENFIYNSREHQYFYRTPEGLIELESTTKFSKKYEPPFDPQGHILNACAKKEGVTPFRMKQIWREKADIGTDCHAVIERFRKTKERKEEYPPEVYPVHAEKLRAFWSLFDRELYKYPSLSPEIKTWSTKYRIGGGPDDTIWKDEKVCVIDYKTNDSLRINTHYLKPPFQMFKDSHVNKFAIQTGIYSVMIEDATGLELGPSFIIWLNGNGEMIQLPDLKKQIRELLEQRAKQFSKQVA